MDSSGSQEKKAVPRFASFKPPAPPPTDPPTEPPKRERTEREKSRHNSRYRSRHRNHRDGRSRSRERQKASKDHGDSGRDHRHIETRALDHTSPLKGAVAEPADDAAELYVVDCKGDKYNLIYGTVHRYSIPRYYRFGGGRVLGLPSNYKIDRDTIGENEIVVRPDTWRTDSSKSKSKRFLSGLDKRPGRLLRVRPTASSGAQINASEDYMPLETSRNQRHSQGFSQASDTDDEKFGYRSIHGKLKPGEGLPNDLELVSETESSNDEAVRADPDAEIKKKNVELSRNVEARPTDVQAWMQLINHQELVLKGSAKESTPLTSAEHKSLADIKVFLYEKALKKAGESTSRDRLLLGLLEEGAKLWDTKKLSARWQSILKTNSHFISLWIKYLDFRQTEFLNFTYDRCLATFIECLSLNKASSESPEKSRVQIYLLVRMTLFLRETGYSELATGLWQAILEWTLFRPEQLDPNKSHEQTLSAFTDFWDSEVPRIGEIGAKGWKSGTATVADPKVFNPKFQLKPKSILASWVECEREHELQSQLPARSLDAPEDDPYRVVLSSDLQKVLPLVWMSNLADELICSFLYFCHLPPIITTHNSETAGRWMGDSFLQNDLMAAFYGKLQDWLPHSSNNIEPGAASPVLFPHQYFIPSFDTYFAGPETWFSSFRAWEKITSDLAHNITRDWVRRTLRLLVEALPGNENLAEYAVAVEFVCNAKEAKKFAKSLLKKRSSSLRLYNSYALMEYRTNNRAAAYHVWATAISMSKSFSDHDRLDSILLWRTWIWELLEARNITHVAQLLVSMPQSHIDPNILSTASDNESFSPTNILKIRGYISDALESSLLGRRANIIVACVECQAILHYLTHTQDLNEALEAYGSTTHRLASLPASAESFKSFTDQLLHQSRARLIYHHLRTSSLYKPAHIRSIITESLSLYPHNTIFLSLFAWNEARFRIEERVRDTMRKITTASRNSNDAATSDHVPITSHLFSIYAELSRPVFAGSTLHSSRAAFEKAIDEHQNASGNTNSADATAHSSLSLWKLYILFELSHDDIRRAKDVFYRAMRACPWSKDLIMLAFTHLHAGVVQKQHPSTSKRNDGMDFLELRRIYNVLVEKELRIHVDIEQELDELAVKMGPKGSTELGIPIFIPEDADSENEEMQM